MKYFKLFSNCISVKGVVKALVCDLQRGDIYEIPLELHDILDQLKSKPLTSLLVEYEDEFHETISNWLNTLVTQEIGFYSNDPENFPDLSMEFDTPEIINNCIIEYGNASSYNWSNIFKQLADVGCKFLEIRVLKKITKKEFEDILMLAKSTNIKGIDILIPFQSVNFTKQLESLLLRYQRIARILIHSVKDSANIYDSLDPRLSQTKENLTSNSCCGKVEKELFASNIKLFTESKNFNNCLNKKISISEHGTIKNCPSLSSEFGSIQENDLKNILSNTEIREKWGITKDKVNVCKSCEYRYICTDCRAFLEDPKDELSKPLKCGYDPNTGKWSNWRNSPQKISTFNEYCNTSS